MHAHRGYYSLIQFCPNPSRLEAVNVGVVLFCPELGFLSARTCGDNRRARKIIAREQFDEHALNAAKHAIANRFVADRSAFRSIEDLQAFVERRANALQLTTPRPVKVFDPPRDLDSLFDELVGGVALRVSTKRVPAVPELEALFQRLQREGRAQLNVSLTVPVLGSQLRVPYTYQNGVLNLVKPERFPEDRGKALRIAGQLALHGDLLRRHQEQLGQPAELIVVASYPECADLGDAPERIADVLSEYEVPTVNSAGLRDFIARVESEAH